MVNIIGIIFSIRVNGFLNLGFDFNYYLKLNKEIFDEKLFVDLFRCRWIDDVFIKFNFIKIVL